MLPIKVFVVFVVPSGSKAVQPYASYAPRRDKCIIFVNGSYVPEVILSIEIGKL